MGARTASTAVRPGGAHSRSRRGGRTTRRIPPASLTALAGLLQALPAACRARTALCAARDPRSPRRGARRGHRRNGGAQASAAALAEIASQARERLAQAARHWPSVPPAARPAFLPLAWVAPLLARIERNRDPFRADRACAMAPAVAAVARGATRRVLKRESYSAAATCSPPTQRARSSSARAVSARFLAMVFWPGRAAARRRVRASAPARAAETARNSRSSAGTSAARHRSSRDGRR